MSFPMIQFKATNTELSGTLQDLIEQKLVPLEKYIADATDAKCEVEFEKETTHQTGRIYRVEVNLFARGTLHRVEATERSFEEAIDEVRDEIDKSLRRTNKKQDTLTKRGARKLKERLIGS